MPFPFPPLLQDEILPSGGILRAARRPANFVVLGPQPSLPPDYEELLPGKDEDLCWLAGNWRILQRVDGHRISLDDLLTAHLAVTLMVDAPPQRFLDLGCGVGSVLCWLAWAFPDAHGVGIEAQALSVALAKRSLRWNGIGDRVEVRNGDLRDPQSYQGLAGFDLITGTPPYFTIGDGPESDGVQRGPCRFEHRGGIEAYCQAAALRLNRGAPFVACEAYLERHRVEPAARAAGLSLCYWQDVVPREGKAPRLSLFAMRVGPSQSPCVVEPPLVVRDRSGDRTREFIAARIRMGMPA